MTKRVLSLLLALVMALSLCVPAFAADDNEQEPAAEVNEVEAVATEPEAEVAPVAADEPVEIAAAPDKGKVADLQAAITKNQLIEADVKAGKYVGGAYTLTKWRDGDPDTQVNSFLKALKAATDLMASINGGYWDGETDPATVAEALTYARNGIADVATDASFKTFIEGKYNSLKGDAALPENQKQYQPGYVTDVAALVDQFLAAYNGGYKYVSVIAAIEAYDALEAKWLTPAPGDVLQPNQKPTSADKDRLDAAVAAAKAALAKTVNEYKQELKDRIAEAEDNYYDPLQANGLTNTATLTQVNSLIDRLKAATAAAKENVYSFKFTSYKIAADYKSVTVTVTASGKPDEAHAYKVKASLNGGTAEIVASSVDYSTAGTEITVQSSTLLDQSSAFKNGDQITFTLYDDNNGKVIDTITVTINTNYNGPAIVDEGQFYVTLNKLPSDGYTAARVEVTRPDGTKHTVSLSTTALTTSWTESTVQVGTYTVKLSVREKTPANVLEWKERQTVTIEVKSIETYIDVATSEVDKAHPYGTAGYDCLLEAVDAADGYENLVSADPKAHSTADARQIVANNLKVANAIVAASATTPNTTANQKKVDDALKNLTAALALLTSAADQSDLDAAIAEAAALVEDDYTAASWADLEAAVAAGKLVKKSAVTDSKADAKAIADAAKAIRDAIKDLAAVAPDTSALKALVDSVPAALAKDNFTAESKAAVEAAAAKAKEVLNKKGALKSEVKAAADALQAALNALTVETKPQGPGAPAGGSGWVHSGPNWYYYQNGTMLTSQWVMSAKGLWYYLGADGVMYTGFQKVGAKYFYFTPGGATVGAAQSGWIVIGETRGGQTNWGWFQTKHNGHFGECTYTTEWGNL